MGNKRKGATGLPAELVQAPTTGNVAQQSDDSSSDRDFHPGNDFSSSDDWDSEASEEGSDGGDSSEDDGTSSQDKGGETSEGEGGEEEEDKDDITEAIRDYMNGNGSLEATLRSVDGEAAEGEGEGDADWEERPIAAPESDSSEDEMPSRNTIGNVPLKWYKDEPHVGYDLSGKKITKAQKRDELDSFLARTDNEKDWRTIYDEYNDEHIELTKDEISMIRRLRQGKIPHAQVNPYEPYVDWFDWEDKGHPLSSAPEPKRRFIPSKWEAKKVVKLVRALRKGWIKLGKPKERPKYYLMWGDDLKTADKTANGLSYIPAPKPKLPGHEESYRPPVEYIPTQEEINSYALMYEEDRPKFIPRTYDALRKIPAYADFIKERFERCLDLYLCPRTRKRRINIDPETLIPKLPKPKDLQPFPTTCFLEYRGHTAAVSSIATDPCGEWLASGSVDGTVRLWEVQNGRCCRTWVMGGPVRQVAWNPNPEIPILAIAVGNEVFLIDTQLGNEEAQPGVDVLLKIKEPTPAATQPDSGVLAAWSQDEKHSGLRLIHQQTVSSVSWHYKGDYFATVAPEGNTRAVLVHQLSKQHTQNPFKKHKGRIVRVLFHPSRPFLFVATKMRVSVYNLKKPQLTKKLMTGLDEISSMAIHPGGDNLLLGSKEAKLVWFDMDLSTKPYKTLKNHEQDIRDVTYHQAYPLFASCSDDGTAHVFHGMVYSDLLQNPLIVPLKILHCNQSASGKGVLDCKFHPTQPWLFTAGADAVIKLFCN